MKSNPEFPYICERCKNAPLKKNWPRPYRWKTKRGFDNHKCYTEAQEKRDKTRAANKDARDAKNRVLAEERERARKEEHDAAIGKRVETAKHKPGDVVFAAFYRVTKPTHEWRNGRHVRMRYEEDRSYQSGEMVVTEILMYGYRAVNKNMQFSSREISDLDIYPTLAEAEEAAKTKAAAYKEQCEFASRCR